MIIHAEDQTHEIENEFKEYISSITTEMMAMSLECAALLLRLCIRGKYKNILDLGSGFSSYVLRYYKKNFDKSASITTVDLDQKWLLKSQKFAKDILCQADNYYLPTYLDKTDKEYDLIFFDIGYYQDNSRQMFYNKYFEKLFKPRTDILFDDCHVGQYFGFIMNSLIQNYHFKLANTYDLTVDKYGRFAMFAEDLIPLGDINRDVIWKG